MSLVYYISSHGYGHLVRSCAIMRELPPELPLIIKTAAPRRILDVELQGRPYELLADDFDCGTVQADSFAVNARLTLETYQRTARENESRLTDEIEFLKTCGARAVASDIPPFALRAARAAGVPSIALANFTWFEIYRPLVARHPEFAPLLEALRRDYALADRALLFPPHVPVEVFPNVIEAPMVARKGRDRGEELRAALAIAPEKKLYMLYLGDRGLAGAALQALADIEDAAFLTLNPLPELPPNVFLLRNEEWWHPDLTASCAAVIGKPGYSLVSECMANGTPLIYTARPDFAEYGALHDALQQWGGGIFVPREEFKKLRLQPWLELAERAVMNPIYDLDGAQFCACEILSLGGWA